MWAAECTNGSTNGSLKELQYYDPTELNSG